VGGRSFDLLGKGGYRYEPEIPKFVGYPDMLFEEDRHTIFFNIKGIHGEIPEALKKIFEYMNNPKAYPVDKIDVELIKGIDAAVKFNQQSPEWRRNYEVLSMLQQDSRIIGKEEGIDIGRREAAREAAIEAIREGVSDSGVARIGKISIGEAKALRRELQNN
jgi:hypothetical protein